MDHDLNVAFARGIKMKSNQKCLISCLLVMKHLERSKRVIYAAAHDVSQVEASQGEQQLVEDVPQLRPESYHFSEPPLNKRAMVLYTCVDMGNKIVTGFWLPLRPLQPPNSLGNQI